MIKQSSFWYSFLILILIGVISSCSVSDQTSRNNAFDKRLYTKGYHFKGFKGNKNLHKNIEKEEELLMSEFQSFNKKESAELLSTTVKEEVIPSSFVVESDMNFEVDASRKKQSKQKSRYDRYKIDRAIKVLHGDTVKSGLKISEEKKNKKINRIRKNYLASSIFGGIAVFFFWSGLLFLIFALVAGIIAAMAASKEKQLNKDGVETDEETLGTIKKLLSVLPLIFLISLLVAIASAITLVIGLIALSAPFVVVGVVLAILAALGYISVIIGGIVLLVQLIRKTIEFSDMSQE